MRKDPSRGLLYSGHANLQSVPQVFRELCVQSLAVQNQIYLDELITMLCTLSLLLEKLNCHILIGSTFDTFVGQILTHIHPKHLSARICKITFVVAELFVVRVLNCPKKYTYFSDMHCLSLKKRKIREGIW